MDTENRGMDIQNFSAGGFDIYLKYYGTDFSSFVNTVSSMTENKQRRCFVIVGDREGKRFNEKALYTQLGQALAQLPIDHLYCFGEKVGKTCAAAREAGLENVSYTNSRAELEEWIQRDIKQSDLSIYGSGEQMLDLTSVIDDVYGTSYKINTQNVEKTYVSVHANFRFVGENLEFYRNEPCSENTVYIPEVMNGVVVSRISPNAFSRCRELRQVVIPSSVTNIGKAAFYICPKLESITLPEQLRVIEDSAFNYCTALKQVELPPRTIHIGRRAFYDCRNLTQLYIPSSVGYIGEEAFANCEKLTVSVDAGSYAETYCRENNVRYILG